MKTYTKEQRVNNGYHGATVGPYYFCYSPSGLYICTCARMVPRELYNDEHQLWAYEECKLCQGFGSFPIDYKELCS